MNLNMSHIRLEYVGDGSNKFYRMTHVYNRNKQKSLLIKNWGAIGKEGQFTFAYDDIKLNGSAYDKMWRAKREKGYSETSRVSFEDRAITDIVTRLKTCGVGEYAEIEGRPLTSLLTAINGSNETVPSPVLIDEIAEREAIQIALEKMIQLEILQVRRLEDPLYGSW